MLRYDKPGLADATMPVRSFSDQQSPGTSGNIFREASASINLHDKSKSRKPSLTYADFHHEITKEVKDMPPSSVGCHQKQWIDRKVTEEDELVKHMSNLPSYLEKGKSTQEKVLNVGVLDWGRLEKWQHSHKQIPSRSSRYSLSSSNTTSCFSTDGSSTHSSRGHSCSPARPRVRRPSLESHFMKSPIEGQSEVVNSFSERVEKFQGYKADPSSSKYGPNKFIGTDNSLCRNHIGIKVEQHMRKDLDPKNELEKGSLLNGRHPQVAAQVKVKKKAQDCEFMMKVENSQKPCPENYELDIPEGCKKVVLLLPIDCPQNNHSGVSQLSGSTTLLHQRVAKTTRESFSERPKEACQLGSEDAATVQFQSNIPSLASKLAKTGTIPSRGGSVEEKKAAAVSTSATVSETYKGLDVKSSKATSEKVRSTSPFRRFSIGVGKISKSFSSKDCSDAQKPSSTTSSANPGRENTMTSTFLDASDGDKLNATGRAKSSPLRRLLDPLLKPKVSNCNPLVEPLEKDFMSKNKDRISSDGRLDSISEQPGKIKLGMTGCRTINVNESSKVKKSGSSAVQALLRVAVKNGHPLFTFAVEKDTDMLAATMKKLNTSEKDGCSCIYTLFNVREVKKKNGSWINQSSKSKSHDYVRNVVAQMKVTDSQFPNLAGMDQFSVREFVLFSVDLRKADCQSSGFQPTDELAAAVVRIPNMINQQSCRDWRQRDSCNNNLTAVGSKEYVSKVRRHSFSGEAVHSKPSVGGEGLMSTTVILPSGIHTVPSNGGPSSLIERWNSGGLCDCGGWDLACKLRVFENQNQASEKLTSHKVCPTTDRFELYPQGGLQESKPTFSLAPFKDGIYSVEFNSSLSILQAFSICIAVLDSRNLSEFSESRNLLEEKTSGETMLMQNNGLSASTRIEGEAPASYVSCPPLSPVGRV